MAIPTVAIVESEMSLHAGQEKKLLQGQIIIAKVTRRQNGIFIEFLYHSYIIVLLKEFPI